MSTDQEAADRVPAGRRDRLARVIATRGGKAEPEAPFVVQHREALIYMLCEAAELERGIMCQYLFAADPAFRSAFASCAERNAGSAANRDWHMMPCSSSAASHSM